MLGKEVQWYFTWQHSHRNTTPSHCAYSPKDSVETLGKQLLALRFKNKIQLISSTLVLSRMALAQKINPKSLEHT